MFRPVRALISISLLLAALSAALPGTGRLPAQTAHASGPAAAKTGGIAASSARTKLTESLRQSVAAAAPGARLRVIVRIKSAALPTTSGKKGEAAASVVSHLQAEAETRQRPVLAFLAQPETAGQSGDVRSLWIINALALTGATPALIDALAARDDVASIEEDGWRQWVQPRAVGPAPALRDGRMPTVTERALSGILVAAPAAGESTWGIQRIRADQVWRGLGVTGAGITVANMDTGVDWQHPSLRGNYRGLGNGFAVDHAHNWLDATNEGSLYPTDGTGHGTHTMGTLAGAGGIGVAPGAKWMAVKVLNSDGFGFDSWIHLGFQFVLAPGGRPDLAPDVLSNSWGNDNGSVTDFRDDVIALRQAGVFTVFANGNSGPTGGTVASPASLPESIGIGATTEDDRVARFSSRGPSPIDQRVKPDLSAPGVNVTSAIPGAAFASFNGTSMATPHVAGAAALLLSAAPGLSIAETFAILTRTAAPLSTTLPNNNTGWGRVDAYAAVLAVIGTGVIEGHIRDGATPVSGAEVLASNGAGLEARAVTDASGYFSMRAVPGMYIVSAGAFGYTGATAPPRLVALNNVTQVDMSISALPSGIVRGTVRDAATGAYITATVRALNTPRSELSNQNCLPCRYNIDLPAGSYVFEARANGYFVQTQTATIGAGALIDLDFAMNATQRIALVDTGAWYSRSAAQYFRDAFDILKFAVDEYAVKDQLGGTPTLTTLLRYDAVIWSAPYDSPALVGASSLISSYLASGRQLILTGQDIAYYDGGGRSYEPYLYSRVNARLLGDNSDTLLAYGGVSGPLAGLTFTLSGGNSANNQTSPDLIAPHDGDLGAAIVNYDVVTTTQTGAAVMTGVCSKAHATLFGFGLEGINGAELRANVIARTLAAMSTPPPTLGLQLRALDRVTTDYAIGQAGESVTHTFRIWNTGAGGVTQTFSVATGTPNWPTRLSNKSVTLAPCESIEVTATVKIPATAGRGERETSVITVQSLTVPTLTQQITFASKTPDAILLIDDDRWFDKEDAYLSALASAGYGADRWSTANMSGGPISPTLAFLRQYPVVIWFNAYDWFDPIRPDEEALLINYLSGGGRLFFTSQAALAYTGRSHLMHRYFGVDGIDFNDVTSNVVGMNNTTLGDGIAGGSMLPFPYNWNLSSALLPTRDAEVLLRGDSLQPFGLIRDGGSWRTAFMPLAFETLPAATQSALMAHITGWLSPMGTSRLGVSTQSPAPGESVALALDARFDDMPLPADESVTIEWFAPNGLSLQTPPLSETVPVSAGVVIHRDGRARVDDLVAPGTLLTVTARLRMNKSGFTLERQQHVRVGGQQPSVTQQIAPAIPRWGDRITVTVRISDVKSGATSGWVISSALPSQAVLDPDSIQITGATWDLAGNLITLRANPGAAQIVATFSATLPRYASDAPAAYELTTVVLDGMGDRHPFQRWVAPFTTRLVLTVADRH